MKNIFIFTLAISVFLIGCRSSNQSLVTTRYVNELFQENNNSIIQNTLNQDLLFWKNRYLNDENSTNAVKYAGALAARFRLKGDISDLLLAQNLILKLDKEAKSTEASLQRLLATYASLQHQFFAANRHSQAALKIGENRYASKLQIFDSAFELGLIHQSRELLKTLKKNHEFDYYFRLAKMHHYDGDLESSKNALLKASQMADGNIVLDQIALSNLADLYMHEGDYKNAATYYKKSLALDVTDYHAIKNLGMISLYHDKNPKLALKILGFISKKTKSPDVLIDYMHIAQVTKNVKAEQKFAAMFVNIASQPQYGNMYNKYLIEMYEGVLNNPQKMLELAKKEIKNRNTAQTKTWLAYALYKNNKKTEAMLEYKNNIAEMPLEGLELYYIGKMMNQENKKYNANKYLEAAYKNRYELEPKKRIELNAI